LPTIDTTRAAELDALVRERFALRGGGRRLGAELEVLPLRASTGAVVLPTAGPDGIGTLGVLRELAARNGWRVEETGYGVPRFVLLDGSMVSYEPGGQLEWSSAVHDSLGSLDAALRDVCDRLVRAMGDVGIRLLARGVDPVTALDDATMVVSGERYHRQRAHYDRRGPAGRTMMLQTAGIHLNLDAGEDPLAAWNVANALAPLLVAMFANSPSRAGSTVAHRSHRAAIWRALDPSRTAVFVATDDPVSAYRDFALAADSFLLGEPGTVARTFADWRSEGATPEDFARHLTTLFPEVRPRGDYLELRSVDALPARWAIVPLAVAWASLHHASLRREILGELPAPTIERLVRAGRDGLGDPALGSEARWLAERVPAALVARGVEDALVERVNAYFDEYTSRARDPGSADESWLES
jgi:glutamate--cysteine ligase